MSETDLVDTDKPEPARTGEALHASTILERRQRRAAPPEVQLLEDDDGGYSIGMCGENGALSHIRGLASTGLHNTKALYLMVHQLTALNPNAFETGDDSHANAAVAMLDELEPQGGSQAMLAAQMVATHIAAMSCFSRAAIKGQTFEGRELNLKHATKLSGLYARQAETLAKLKRKGQQTVNVRHVHVHDGGQAVVGNVASNPG